MGSQSEQNQDLYDYVICGYVFLEDRHILQSSDLKFLEVELRAASWLAVLLRTLTYQYFWSKQVPPMKRYLHQQCPPRLSSQNLSFMMITALISTLSWAQVVGTEADWNIKGEPSPHLNNRRLDLHRGRYYTAMLPSMVPF